MRYLDLTLPAAADNLALDEALLLEAEAGRGGEVLRLWEWQEYAVVLGAGGVIADDVDESACTADAVPILRRSSGGGTVLLGPGCLLFSLVLSYERSPALTEIRSSYCYILDRIARSLEGLAPAIAPRGTSDIAGGDRKFSGNSQQRKRRHLLHHGTLLYAFGLSRLERYLRPPPRQPEYRSGRSHLDFAMNLACPADELRRRLRREWGAEEEQRDWPADEVRRLVEDKYARKEWQRRR